MNIFFSFLGLFLLFFLFFLRFSVFFPFFWYFSWHDRSCHVCNKQNLYYSIIIQSNYLYFFFSSLYFFIFDNFFIIFSLCHVASCHVMSLRVKKKKIGKGVGQFFFYTSNKACMQNFMLLSKIPTNFCLLSGVRIYASSWMMI